VFRARSAALEKGRAVVRANREARALNAVVARASAKPPKLKRSTGRSRLGLHALKAKVNIHGVDAINKSTAAGRLLVEWRDELVNALGGSDAITPQQKCLVEIACRSKLICDHIDWFIMQQETLIFFRKKSAYPIVLQRAQLAAQLEKTLTTLGLQRVAKKLPSFDEYMKELAAKKEAERKQQPIDVANVVDGATPNQPQPEPQGAA
jgi:hypothetical protein